MRNEGGLSGLRLGSREEALPANWPFFTRPLFPATLLMKGRNGSSSIGCGKPPPHAAQALDEHALRPSASVDALRWRSCVGSPGALAPGVLLPKQPPVTATGRQHGRKNSWERGFLPRNAPSRDVWRLTLCSARAGRPQGNGSDILGELPAVGRFDTVPPTTCLWCRGTVVSAA